MVGNLNLIVFTLTLPKGAVQVKKIEHYRAALSELESWDEYLLRESGLPGPRGNIELAQAVAEEGDLPLFRRYLAYGQDIAPTNSPYEFLAFCGVLGLGRLIAEGDKELLADVRRSACDPRWRMREAVAMALQWFGDRDMKRLIAEMRKWSAGSLLEKRAAAAALCEPRLLASPQHAREVLHILDRITTSLLIEKNRKSDEFTILRKGLGYCWSVAIAALPEEGIRFLEKWLAEQDKDIQWIMRENLKKKRLTKVLKSDTETGQ